MEPRIEPPAYHGLKCYHKNNYYPPSNVHPVPKSNYNHQIVSHFHSKGLEKKTTHEGLIYGTDTKYPNGKPSEGRRVDDRL